MLVGIVELVNSLGLRLSGPLEGYVDCIGFPERHSERSLCWAGSIESLGYFKCGVVIVEEHMDIEDSDFPCLVLLRTSEKARLVFSRAYEMFFKEKVDLTNHIGLHRFNPSLVIGENVYIGNNVIIGSGTVIHPGVILYNNTVVGENCILRSNCSVGTEGLGFEFDPLIGRYREFPQIGNVVLEDYVEVGPSSTIRRASLGTTRIGFGTKIGSSVNIGHNCNVGANCIFTSNVCLAGSVIVGENVYFGVGSSVRNKLKIIEGAVIGQGAVVVKDIIEKGTYFGMPAKRFSV
jgi:acyl-[acyl carrier protein]--UDP-N-acetylglucosamine O-acyltransferase